MYGVSILHYVMDVLKIGCLECILTLMEKMTNPTKESQFFSMFAVNFNAETTAYYFAGGLLMTSISIVKF